MAVMTTKLVMNDILSSDVDFTDLKLLIRKFSDSKYTTLVI